MSIVSNSIITWSDFTAKVLSELKAKCCNIGAFSSSLPNRLRYGTGNTSVSVWTRTTSQGGSLGSGHANIWQQQTFSFQANNADNTTNRIEVVSEADVNTEWTTFLAAAGINARSTKVIQGKDLCMAMGLCQQFMSGHVKPFHSRRQIYGESEFYGARYARGTISPKYTLTPIEPGSVPVMENSDITGGGQIINQSIINEGVNWGMFTANDAPMVHKCNLS